MSKGPRKIVGLGCEKGHSRRPAFASHPLHPEDRVIAIDIATKLVAGFGLFAADFQ
jgi:hypothetical protein